jgi:glyoxylase-like metal-dependent hydrolase (beta-lactamase superfamily II)
MSLEVKRLHLASMSGWPVHGFVVTHPGGAVLVDTGVGGPDQLLNEQGVINRSVAEALAELDMSPGDIGLVINTHLHFDHCGQNSVFRHAPHYVQRAELARAQSESPEMCDWFGFMDAPFELLDGDAELLPGVSVITTPGHTAGHQCVVVDAGGGAPELLIGDAAWTPREYGATDAEDIPPGQAADLASWRDSIRRIRSVAGARIHFSHHTDIARN